MSGQYGQKSSMGGSGAGGGGGVRTILALNVWLLSVSQEHCKIKTITYDQSTLCI